MQSAAATLSPKALIDPDIAKAYRQQRMFSSQKKEDITLSIWDFAGQDLYYTTHQVGCAKLIGDSFKIVKRVVKSSFM